MADRSLVAILGANVTGFVSGMGVAKQAAIGFARETTAAFDLNAKAIDRAGKTQQEVSALNARALDTVSNSAFKTGAALTAVAAFAVKSAMDWESAWTGVLKTVEGTPSQLALVEQGLRDLATAMPESHQEIAAVAEAAGQLGVAREDIVAFTETMVMLGDTTNLSSDEAATSIAQLMNVMGTAPKDVDRLGATIVDLGNKGASTERQIVQMAQRIAGAARVVGLSEANVLALANAVASTGVEVELGGTAISQVLLRISKDVVTNSSTLHTWGKLAGLSAKEFADAWRSDPAEALTRVTAGLHGMGAEAAVVFDQLGLDGARVQQVLLNLAFSNDKLVKSLRDGDIAWQQNIALVAEAEKRYDTAEARAKIAWNNIRDAGIDAGTSLLPVVSELFDAVSELASVFGLLPDEVQGVATGLVGVTGITLLAFAAITKLTAGVAANRLAMMELAATAPATAAGIGKVAAAAKLALVSLAAVYALDTALKAAASPDLASTAKFTQQLLGVADGSKQARAELEALATSRMVDGLADAFDQAGNSVFGFLDKLAPGQGGFEQAADVIGQIDEALASMVQSGSADKAAESLAYLQEVTGRTKSELLDQLPLYDAELEKVATESVKTTSAFDDLAGGSDALALRLAQLSSDPEKAAEALAKMHKETTEAARSFADFTADLEDSGQSFDSWLADLEKAAEAQDKWADNLIKAAVRGLPEGLIAELEAAGPQAAALVEEIANSSEEELARVIDVWERTGDTAAHAIDQIPPEILTQFNVEGADDVIQAAADVANQYGVIPADVRTILEALDWATEDIDAVIDLIEEYNKQKPHVSVTADTSDAESDIRGLMGLLDDLAAKASRADSYGVFLEPKDGGAIQRFAVGGWPRARGAMRGPGGPRDDQIPAMLSNGEHVLTASDVTRLGGQEAVYQLRAEIQSGEFGASPRFYSMPAPTSPTLVRSEIGLSILDVSFDHVGNEMSMRIVAHDEAKNVLADNMFKVGMVANA